jgi:hypothetical protein
MGRATYLFPHQPMWGTSCCSLLDLIVSASGQSLMPLLFCCWSCYLCIRTVSYATAVLLLILLSLHQDSLLCLCCSLPDLVVSASGQSLMPLLFSSWSCCLCIRTVSYATAVLFLISLSLHQDSILIYGQYTAAKGCVQSLRVALCIWTAFSRGILPIYHTPLGLIA